MKILVPVKRVVDYNVKIRIKSDGSGVELANVKMSMNPFDEIAVEEALRQKEAGKATEVVVVSIGPPQAAETIRTALAMGADRGILITVDGVVEPLAVAKLLKGVVAAEQPGLVILGKQAIDDDCNQTGQMLAALTGLAQGTFASKVVVGDGKVDVTREVDGGMQTVSLKLPAIVTTDLRLNEPRYASLPNIMKAKKKPIDQKKPEDYGVDVAPRVKVLKTTEPGGRKAGVKVKTRRRARFETSRRSGSNLNMTTLLLGEVAGGHLADITARALTAAKELGAPVEVLIAGHNPAAAAEAAAKLDGVAKVRVADDAAVCARPRRAAGGADRRAGRRVRRHSRRFEPVLQERAAARGGAARRDAAFRHHQGAGPEELRAADLRRQRDPDGRIDRSEDHRHRAHRLVRGDGRGFGDRADRAGGGGGAIPACRVSSARRWPSPTGPS